MCGEERPLLCLSLYVQLRRGVLVEGLLSYSQRLCFSCACVRVRAILRLKQVILYEEMVMNRPVVAQKLQGVGFSKEEVRKANPRLVPCPCGAGGSWRL